MTRLRLCLAAMLWASALSAVVAAASNDAIVATVQSLSGQAWYGTSPAELHAKRHSLSSGMRVPQHSYIETGPLGRCTIELTTLDVRLTIAPSTCLSLRDYVRRLNERRSKHEGSLVDLLKGTIKAIVGPLFKADKGLYIRSANAMCGVRGSIVVVSFDDDGDGGETKVFVLQAGNRTVRVTTNDDELAALLANWNDWDVLTTGQQTSIVAALGQLPPSTIPPQVKEQLLALLGAGGETATEPERPHSGRRLPPDAGSTAKNQTRLAEAFAPEFRFHRDCPYRPAPVPWYLARVALFFDDEQVLSRTALADDTDAYGLLTQYAAGECSGAGMPSRFTLAVPEDDERETTYRGSLTEAPCYYRYVHGTAPYLDLQYWLFFPFQGNTILGTGTNTHEGDWQHVTVRLEHRDGTTGDEPTFRLHSMFLAAGEDGGRRVLASEVRTNNYGRPIVYVARHDHSLHSQPGTFTTAGNGLPRQRQVCHDDGPNWPAAEHLLQLSEDNAPWLAFTGRWGLPSGDYGPARQAAWRGDTPEERVPPREVLFYGKENCAGPVICRTNDDSSQAIDCRVRRGLTDGAVRSCELRHVTRGTLISFYDSPHDDALVRSHIVEDDYTIIEVLADDVERIVIPSLALPGSGVETYEHYRITHRRQDGLVGDVTLITIDRLFDY